ncbi:MAG: efflux RND transporter permease subunit [Limnochordia bacterium]|nr:efflux RND transporter permease subunit [Limnochordia bacterium]
MRLPSFAVSRTVTMTMLIIAALIFGGIGLDRLGLELLPDLNIPMMTIATLYPLANPETVEKEVTTPIEQAMSTIPNVRKLESISTENVSLVMAQFNWGTDLDKMVDQVRISLDRLSYQLPTNSSAPLIMLVDPNQTPLMLVGVSGALESGELTAVVDDFLPALERIPGVASITATGGAKEEIYIKYNQEKLQQYGLTTDQLKLLLQAQNVVLPIGAVEKDDTRYLAKVGNNYRTIDDLRNMIIGEQEADPLLNQGLGALVPKMLRLHHIAEVGVAYKPVTGYSRVDDKPAIMLSIYKQPGKNTVQVADEINATLARIKQTSPHQLEFFTLQDQSLFVRDSISWLSSTMVVGAILAVIVLFAFLQSIASIACIMVAIPLSIMITFFLMYLSGLTLNLMTLGGLALGVGMLVDNAIVVLESIYRQLQQGKKVKEAVIQGTNQVASAITASTITTLAVFIPVVFLGGIAGEIFKELGITISYALVASLLVALTAIPMLASKIFGRAKTIQFERSRSAKLDGLYRTGLEWAVNHKPLIIGLAIVLLVCSAVTLLRFDVEFLPPMDQSMLMVNMELPPGITLDETNSLVTQVEEQIRSIPEVTSIASLVGSWADDVLSTARGASVNTAKLTVMLSEKNQRNRSAAQVAEEIKKVLAPFKTANFEVIHDIVGANMGMKQIVTLDISGPDFEVLTTITEELETALVSESGFGTIVSSLDKQQPELFFEVNPFRALSGSVTATHIALAMRDAIGGAEITDLQLNGRTLPVVLRPDYDPTTNYDALTKHRIASALQDKDGQSYVVFDRVANVTETSSMLDIYHTERVRAVTLTATLDGIGLREAMTTVDKLVSNMDLPPGYAVKHGGVWEIVQESFGELLLALILAVVLVYMVMAAQFESFAHPLIIMITVPLAAIGSLFGLYLTGGRIGVPSLIGMIMLVGIAVNNGIVLIDQINYLRREEGLSLKDSVLQGSCTRLRPVLMTSLTTILALVPLALGFGDGAEVLKPLAITVVFGLSVSAVMTLFVIPVVYHLFENSLIRTSAKSTQGECSHVKS